MSSGFIFSSHIYSLFLLKPAVVSDLLRRDESVKGYTEYLAQHWVDHVQFEGGLSHTQDAMDTSLVAR
jgi:hypothetical protein